MAPSAVMSPAAKRSFASMCLSPITSPIKAFQDYQADRLAMGTQTEYWKTSRGTCAAVGATVAVCALMAICGLIAIGQAGPSHPAMYPDESPQATMSRARKQSGFRKLLDRGSKTLASGLVSVGSSLDPEVIYEHTPAKGFIRKQLEITRQELGKQLDQQDELQRFYEAELLRMRSMLSKEEEVLKEVLGDDYHVVEAALEG